MQSPMERRLLRVVDHIHDNPGADLSLDALADVAAMSRFHWHRVYKALTGETCAQSVRRIRLHIAAAELSGSKKPLAVIAAEVGYPDPDSFARAFSQQYGLTPARFRERRHPAPLIRNTVKEPQVTRDFPVTVTAQPVRRLAGMPHKGAYFRISQAFARLDVILAARGLTQRMGEMVAVFYDDPDSTAESDLTSFAAFGLPEDMDLPEGLELRDLPGGDHAVLTYEGPYDGLPAAYAYLFGTWLPQSGREPADAPSFEVYRNTPLNTAPSDLVTDIHLPLE